MYRDHVCLSNELLTNASMNTEDQCEIPHGEWNESENTITLTAPREFSFAETIVYLTRSANECLHHVENNRVYKLLSVANQKVLIEIIGQTDSAIQVHFLNTIPTKEIRAMAAGYVREWFDFETDLTPFYRQTEQCPLIKELAEKHFGLRVIGIPDLFEALCWAIIGQQINLTFAYTLKRRFVELFGDSISWNNRSYWIFPSPAAIAQLNVKDLMQLQFTSKKSESIIDVAKQIAEGTISKEYLLQTGDFKDAEKKLVKLRGIGPWTANYVLMRCLRDPSAFPIADVGLHNAIKHRLKLDRKPTLEEIRKLSVNWKNWEAYATFYLWRSLYNQDARKPLIGTT